MKKIAILAAAVGALGLIAGSAIADTSPNGDPPCTYDTAAKAKTLKTAMVRAYAACGGSSTYPSPNSLLGATNTDACAPSAPLSDRLYGPKGACSFGVKAGLDLLQTPGDAKNRCFPDTSVTSCGTADVKAKCKDVRESDGATLIQEDQALPEGGWKLNTFTRGTLDDRVNGGAHTAIDFPVTFKFGPANKGGLKLKDDSNKALFDLLGFGSALPPCMSLELLSISIVDPDTQVFAVMGVSAGTN